MLPAIETDEESEMIEILLQTNVFSSKNLNR